MHSGCVFKGNNVCVCVCVCVCMHMCGVVFVCLLEVMSVFVNTRALAIMFRVATHYLCLQEFVTTKHWAHLDIAGVMYHTDAVPYLGKGMSG